MIRRRFVPLIAAATAALVLSACNTVTDNDVAARVDDVELSQDDFSNMLEEVTGADEEATAPMGAANEILNNFVLDQILRADLVAAEVAVPDPPADATHAALQQSVGDVVAAWQTTPPATPDPDFVRTTYQLGPGESAIACTKHILVETEDDANEVLDRLDEGEEFADLATEFSIDPGSAENGGVLPCDTTTNFAQTYIAEFVEAALGAEIGEPVGPIESQFGFHVIEVREFDEIDAAELDTVLVQPQIRFTFAIQGHDVYIDPRYGTFDGARGVVPLG